MSDKIETIVPSEIEQIKGSQDAYLYNLKAMNTIVAAMRESTAVIENTHETKDSFALSRVEMPDEGGVLTYMIGQEYPYKGFPVGTDFVDKIDTVKKLGRGVLSGFYHEIYKTSKWKLIFFIPIVKNLVRIGLFTSHKFIERFKVKPLRYCDAVRELHKTFPEDELGSKIRDILCMTLEFDNAYRFRFQDVIKELDQKRITKKPIKELTRLLDTLIERENTQEIKDTWILVKLLVRFYLPFDRKVLRIIKTTFSKVDIEKVKLSVEDISYCKPRKDYTFGFMK